jgi:hypothetical protein
MNESMQKLETELVAKYGEAQRARLQRGMKQVADFWRAEDGDQAAYEDLVRTHFAGDQASLDALFNRMQFVLESIGGHMQEIGAICAGRPTSTSDPCCRSTRSWPATTRPRTSTTTSSRTSSPSWCCSTSRSRRSSSASPRARSGRGGNGRKRRSASTFSKRIPSDVNLADRESLGGRIAVRRHVQHLDASPRRRERRPPLPGEDAAARALEPARRDQGQLQRSERPACQAAHDPARDGAHRRSDDPRGRRRQPARRLESVHE